MSLPSSSYATMALRELTRMDTSPQVIFMREIKDIERMERKIIKKVHKAHVKGNRARQKEMNGWSERLFECKRRERKRIVSGNADDVDLSKFYETDIFA